MRIKALILALLFLFYGAGSTFAASVDAPTNIQSEIQIDQSFPVNSNLTDVQSGEIYFVKCRIGSSSSSLTDGQTYNSTTTSWLFDTGSWSDMPTITATDPTTNFSIQCKIKSSVTEGQKIIYTRACLRRSDGTCGTSFQSASGINFIAIAPTPTPTPTPASTTDPSPSPSQSTSSFTISDIPSQINSDQSFNVKITLSMPNSANTDYYLKGAFKKSDSTRYLGLTKKDSEWVEYGDEYSEQYKITTDSSGNWSGNIEVKPDTLDKDYKGSGDYIFKVSRYTANGSQTWSNESTIKIISTENSQGETLTTTPTPKANPSTSPSAKTKTNFPQSKSYDTLVYHSATVAGATAAAKAATPSAEVAVKNQKRINPIIWVGLVFILIGVGSVGYIYLQKNGKIPF